MLTRKQQELLAFIDQRLQADGVSPSFEEMKDALQLRSKSGVHRLINALEERRFIRRLPNRARALEVLQMPDAMRPARPALTLVPPSPAPRPPVQAMIAANDTVVVPLHGRIAAGLPVEALESDRSLAVPAALLGPGDHYALEVSGDSMIDAGIFDGDTVIIRKGDTASNGDIIVALVDDEEATLKRLRRKGDSVALEAANPTYETRIFGPDRIRVQGRLVGLLRKY